MTIVTQARGHSPPYLEADAAPGQDSDGARHGEPKLDKVASIVVTFNEGKQCKHNDYQPHFYLQTRHHLGQSRLSRAPCNV